MGNVINIYQQIVGKKKCISQIQFATTDKKVATKFFREQRNLKRKQCQENQTVVTNGHKSFRISQMDKGTIERWYWETTPINHHKVWISNEKWVWRPYKN